MSCSHTNPDFQADGEAETGESSTSTTSSSGGTASTLATSDPSDPSDPSVSATATTMPPDIGNATETSTTGEPVDPREHPCKFMDAPPEALRSCWDFSGEDAVIPDRIGAADLDIVDPVYDAANALWGEALDCANRCSASAELETIDGLFTVEVWMRPSGPDNGTHDLIDISGQAGQLTMAIEAGPAMTELIVVFDDRVAPVLIRVPLPPMTDTWMCAAVLYDGTNLYAIVDTLEGTGAANSDQLNQGGLGGTLFLGGDGPFAYRGHIDGLRIWDDAIAEPCVVPDDML